MTNGERLRDSIYAVAPNGMTGFLKFGVAVWRLDFDRVRELCVCCEKMGYDFFFYGEGLGPECFTTLSALATETKRIRLGPGITFLTYRHPVLLAKIAATLDRISEGRLEIRLGAGAAPGYGVARPDAKVRFKQLKEGLEIINGLLVNGSSNVAGESFSVKDAVCDVRPVQTPHPPITIAARQARMLELVATYGDVWEGFFPPTVYRERMHVLKGFCDAVQRGSNEVAKAVMLRVFIGRSQDQANQVMNSYVRAVGVRRARMEMLKERDAVGDPQSCLNRLDEYVGMGVTRFTLLFPSVDHFDELELFADEVMSKMR